MGHGETSARLGLFRQVMATFSMSLIHFNVASTFAFSGVFTEQMTSEGAEPQLSRSQISWIASITTIGGLVGYIMSSFAFRRLGTLRMLQLASPVIALGWTTMAFGTSFWTILAGRLVVGMALGLTSGSCVAYVGEIATVRYRGYLTNALIIGACTGLVVCFLGGWLLGWRHTCLVIGIGPMAIVFVSTLMLPRPAKWLISHGYSDEEAIRSIKFFHGDNCNTNEEIKAIFGSLGESQTHRSYWATLLLFRKPEYHKPFALMLMMLTFIVWTGGLTTTSFAPVVFRNVGASDNPYLGAILVGAVRLIATIISSFTMERVRRTTLLMINGVLGGAACLLTGFYFHFIDQLKDYPWIPMLAVLSVVGTMSLGVSPVNNVLLSEILPNAIRSVAVGLVQGYFGVMNFGMVYTFPEMVAALGMSGTYWFFAGVHFLMFLSALLLLPDTKGKSLEEIQKLFAREVVEIAAEPVRIHTDTLETQHPPRFTKEDCAV